MKKLLAGIVTLVLSISGVALFSSNASALTIYSNGSGCTAYNYSQGGYSSCVGYIQRILNANTQLWAWHGYINCGYKLTTNYLSVDNSFGPQTAAKVKNYQGSSCLTADGIVGPNTWRRLCSDAGTISRYYGSNTDAVYAARSAGCVVY